MARRTILFLVCAFEIGLLLFATTWAAGANTNIIKCGAGVYKHTFSHAEKSILKREYGKWKDWCPKTTNTLTITPDSAICETRDYEFKTDGRPVDALAAIDFLFSVYTIKICVRGTEDCHIRDEVECSRL
jgi:hypothetical protein